MQCTMQNEEGERVSHSLLEWYTHTLWPNNGDILTGLSQPYGVNSCTCTHALGRILLQKLVWCLWLQQEIDIALAQNEMSHSINRPRYS